MTAPRYLLDTNICIFIRRKRPPSVVREFAKLQRGEAVLSAITYGELLYGVQRSDHRESALLQLEELAQLIPVMTLPKEASEIYGSLRAELERKGEVIGNNDLWIAAHAKASGLTLVTNNEREFRRVAGLQIANWAA